MKKEDQGTKYDLDLSEISDTKATIDQKLPDFIRFSEEYRQLIPGMDNKTKVHINQTWSVPGGNYSWFPYYMMYVSSEEN